MSEQEPKLSDMPVPPFEDIRIIGLDVAATKPSRRVRAGLFLMHLSLSASPPHDWVTLFKSERQSPRIGWRHAEVCAGAIVVECGPLDLDSYLLNELKREVEQCNQKYRQYLKGSRKKGELR